MQSDLPPILSFDFNTFLEHGSMMSREHVLLRLAAHRLVMHSTPPNGRHIRAPDQGMLRVCDALYHYTNPWFLPEIYRFPPLNGIAGKLRARHRRVTLRALSNGKKPILYLWHPFFSDEIGRYNEQLIIYHIYDDYSTLPGNQPDLAMRETAILKRADVVFVINESLLKNRKSLIDREYIHLPQGVDYSIFEAARNSRLPVPTDMGCIAAPRVGYVGRVNAKVDIDLVTELATRRPAWSFVFIGPVDRVPDIEDSLRRLESRPNVHFLGAKPFNEIPRYWLHLDVAIVPYRSSTGQWAHFGSPLKLREAFAAGKPVVASPLDDIESFRGLARIAATHNDWLEQIQLALDSRTDTALQDAFLGYAAANSWDARTRQIQDVIASRAEAK